MKLEWVVHYEDGTCFPQFDPGTMKENMWSDVKINKVVKLGYYMYDSETYKILPLFLYELNIDKNMIPIMFRRRSIQVRNNDKTESIVYVMGYTDEYGNKHTIDITEKGEVTMKCEYANK